MKKQHQNETPHVEAYVPEGFEPVAGVEGLYIDTSEEERMSPEERETSLKRLLATLSPFARRFLEIRLNIDSSNGSHP